MAVFEGLEGAGGLEGPSGERERVGGWLESLEEAMEVLSQDDKCQRGCSLPPLLPGWLAAGVLIIFLAPSFRVSLSSGSPVGGPTRVSSSVGRARLGGGGVGSKHTVSCGAERERQTLTLEAASGGGQWVAGTSLVPDPGQ